VSPAPALLARGPWAPEQVTARWRDDHFTPDEGVNAAADAAIAELRERGSPSHDGAAARLVDFAGNEASLHLELQPVRWSLRLVPEEAAHSISALCVVRAADGRWLAGRRAAWLAAWAGRWALGAGGAVEVGENPAETLSRELLEEWSVKPERLSVEALVRVPSGLVLLVGLAWLPDGATVTPDEEHDAFEWWPTEVDEWPEHADATLRRMAGLLSG
jgi:ADP-ribose pyrophosphatase YjhB (NUDIX family)